ncbi:MAG: cation:proton antiporter [Spirochaetia bacterium]|nr:cation:proton antiporter [Spirochaetia bacterium]
MAFGIAELILIGLLVAWLFEQMHLPGLIGLLVTGMLLGPFALDLITPELQRVSSDLRLIALIVILLRAGFELSRLALQRVGFRALLMAFVPCLFEVSTITLTAPHILPISTLEAAMLGSVLAAVSPAVIVPHMIELIEEGRGVDSGVPTLILAGASSDDAFAIVLATSFIGMYVGESVSLLQNIISVPVSIVTGIATGIGIGYLCYLLFRKMDPRATKRTLIVIGIAVMLLSFERGINSLFPFSALLAVMAIGFYILERDEHMAHEISSKLGKVWVFAQILLFALIGAEVDIPTALQAGAGGIAVIAIGLAGRSAGVQLSLFRSRFTARERLFITIAYLPKATVQAAIGSYPLIAMQSSGMETAPGMLILAVAVMSIILTAPLGSALITLTKGPLLTVCAAQQGQDAYLAAEESR